MNALATTSFDLDETLFTHSQIEFTSGKTEETVLLAEDDGELRLVMEWTLRSMGYKVLSCSDAYVAMTTFGAHAGLVDVLLTDLQMPGMSGIQLARTLVAAKSTLPVLLLTGSILTIDNVKELVSNGWAYMSKPCDMKILSGTLHRLANRSSRSNSL